MRGVINGTYINRTIVDGAGWESLFTADLFATQADATAASSATTLLVSVATLEDAEDFLLGMTLTAVDAQAPKNMANHTLAAAMGASVGGGSSTVMDGHGTALDSAVAVAAALFGDQAAHQLLASGELDYLAAELAAVQAAQTLAASGTVQLAAGASYQQLPNIETSIGFITVASVAQLTQGDTLLATIRMLIAKRQGSGISRHDQSTRITPHTNGSRLTTH